MTTADLASDQRTEYGNFEANQDFLRTVDLLKPGMQILEIGTGTGGMLNRMVQEGLDVKGVEINPEFIAKAHERFGDDLPVTQVDGTELPFEDDAFDAVFSFDVFEHIPDSDAHLREVTRVLRPGGVYLMQTPNKFTNVVFETLRWRSLTAWKSEHCSLHSRKDLAKRFDAHGYDVSFFEIKVVTEFFRAKVRRQLGALGMLALKIANPDRWPKNLKTNIYLVATRRGADEAANG